MNPLNSKKHNIIGKTFNRLTVLSYEGKSKYKCRCECGNECVINGQHIRRGHTKSCGCYQRERLGQPNLKKRRPGTELRNLFRSYQRRASSKGFEFMLSLDQAKTLFESVCFYCDAPPNQVRKGRTADGALDYVYNGIDRLDSTKGYTEDNTVAACGTCNYAKSILGFDEFCQWIKRVYKNLQRRK